MGLRNLDSFGNLGDDYNNFNNYISYGILDMTIVNNGKNAIKENHITQLSYINYMTQQTLDKIKLCLDSLNIEFKIDDSMYGGRDKSFDIDNAILKSDIESLYKFICLFSIARLLYNVRILNPFGSLISTDWL